MEIAVKPAGKHLLVSDLCFMAFTRFELNLAFQVDVAAGKQSEFYVLCGNKAQIVFKILLMKKSLA